ncbi:acyltransferase [Lacinutrix jangbogonensis]|uniref:acyltransferase n=1 Tax=Lacinutrix jangbogonensis TaxID=1469557 RepID=UPI00053EB32A|nr:acyltransferase family protein [Lacinutrix jangbogonensis]
MKGKLSWLDNVRVISTIAVVILHVSSPILYKYGEIPVRIWNIGNLFDGATRFCVPVFFMISGALLLSKDYELSYFIKKRFWRIIPPLLFWSLIYISYDYIILGENSYSLIDTIKLIIRKIFYGSKFHLWFVYTLLGLYLFIPILRKWIKNSNENEILYFLVIWFATILYSIPHFKMYFPKIPLTNFTGYIGYLVLGYYLSNFKLKYKYTPIIFIILGITITIYGTYYITQNKGEFAGYFYGYLTPNVALSSIGIFLTLKNISIKNKMIKAIISFLNNHSFGIYLAHILILTLINKLGISWEFTTPVISIPITSLICISLSSLTIFLLRKIKYGHYISG